MLYLGIATDVIVESQFGPDYDFVEQLGGNMHAVSLGAGDWVDPDLFSDGRTEAKDYDLVMVASWLSLKRHKTLFAALQSLGHSRLKVALVGYPFGGRTVDDIRKEAAARGVLHMLDFHESVPPASVSRILRRSKVCVMLTKREGANKAIYEALFSNVPIIVSESNWGVNREHVNAETGIFSADDALASAIDWMTEKYATFTPRAWAIANTGYPVATKRLNDYIRALALENGEVWTKDIYAKKNTPNARYVHTSDRDEAQSEYPRLHAFLRT